MNSIDDELDFEEYDEEFETKVNSFLYDESVEDNHQNEENVNENGEEVIDSGISVEDSNQTDGNSNSSSVHDSSHVNDQVNHELSPQTKSQLPVENQVEQVCHYDNNASDSSDDKPKDKNGVEVHEGKAKTNGDKVVVEEASSRVSSSLHESATSTQSDSIDASKAIDILENFLEESDSGPLIPSNNDTKVTFDSDKTKTDENKTTNKALNSDSSEKRVTNNSKNKLSHGSSLTASTDNNTKTAQNAPDINKNSTRIAMVPSSVVNNVQKTPDTNISKSDRTSDKSVVSKNSHSNNRQVLDSKVNSINKSSGDLDKNSKITPNVSIENKSSSKEPIISRVVKTGAKQTTLTKVAINDKTETTDNSSRNRTPKSAQNLPQISKPSSINSSVSRVVDKEKTDSNVSAVSESPKTKSINKKSNEQQLNSPEVVPKVNNSSAKQTPASNELKSNRIRLNNTNEIRDIIESIKMSSIDKIKQNNSNLNLDKIKVKASSSFPSTAEAVKSNDVPKNVQMTPKSKTLDIDKRYYNSMRIYLTDGTIFGFEESSFVNEAKKFKLKGGKLYFQNRLVVEEEEEQRAIAVAYHLNANARAKHRKVAATVKAIESKYFWGGCQLDVENVINHCRVCNPRDDLTSFQLWKFIEVGLLLNNILIVRDLNDKSAIFNCSFIETLSAQNLSKHLVSLFHKYGTPYAIRIVLSEKLKSDFSQQFIEFLKQDLLEFIEDVKRITSIKNDKNAMISLPMVDIKLEIGDEKCPKNDEQLLNKYFAIEEDDDTSQLYVFCCDDWLIRNDVYDSICSDITNFTTNSSDWPEKLSSLTLYFQINGINIRANEIDKNSAQESCPSSAKKLSSLKEIQRLQFDMKSPKRTKKSILEQEVSFKLTKKSVLDEDLLLSDESSNDSPEDDVSKKRNSIEMRKTKTKEALKTNFEIIDIADSSNSSNAWINVPLNSGTTDSSNTKTSEDDLKKYDPKGECKTCFVVLKVYSEEYLEDAINGRIKFEEESDEETLSELRAENSEKPKRAVSNLSSNEELGIEEISRRRSKRTANQLSTSQESVEAEVSSYRPKRRVRQISTSQETNYQTPKSGSKRKASQISTSQESVIDETPNNRPKRKVSQLSVSQESVESKSPVKRSTPSHREYDEDDSDLDEDQGVDVNYGSSKKPAQLEVFNCHYCSYSSNDKKMLIMHSATHRRDSQLISKVFCDICCKEFFNSENLTSHKEEEHPPVIKNTIPYGCSECKDLTCYSVEEIDQHLQTHIETLTYLKVPKYRCAICKKFTDHDRQKLLVHITQSHRLFKCAFDCSYRSSNFNDLERHAERLHSRFGKQFKCKYCVDDSASFACFGSLIGHRKQNHAIDWDDNKDKCCLCDLTFNYDDSNAILNHFTSHCTDFAFFECKSCLKRCKKFEQIRSHCTNYHESTEAERNIRNLEELFEDLKKQVKQRNDHQNRKQSSVVETQNAVKGLMEEDFPVEYGDEVPSVDQFGAIDPLASAVQSTLCDEGDEETPVLSIPEEADEEYVAIFVGPDGQYFQ